MEEKQQTAACMIRKGMAEQLIFAGVVGMVLAPFLWPFFSYDHFSGLNLNGTNPCYKINHSESTEGENNDRDGKSRSQSCVFFFRDMIISV